MNIDSTKIRREAVKLAGEVGLVNLTCKALCDRLGIPEGSFRHYAFCTFTELLEEMAPVSMGTHKLTKRRCNAKLKRDYIFAVVVELSRKYGYLRVTYAQISTKADISVSLIRHYFSTLKQLRRDVMRHAVKAEILEIIAQGVVSKDPHAQKISDELKRRAFESYKG